MRHLPSLLCWAVLAWFGAYAFSDTAKPSRKNPVNYVRSSELRISFTYNAGNSGDKPTEVQLHVSRDQGNTWVIAQRTNPAAKNFIFRAPKDGEYWFMPRTKYQSGKYLPVGPPKAEAKAIVDTTVPELNLEAIRGQGGEVHVRWGVRDANLAPATFKIEYQIAGANAAWQKVAVDPLAPGESEKPLEGEIAFVPQGRPEFGAVTVRAEVLDLAGNRTVAERAVAEGSDAAYSDDHLAGVPATEKESGDDAGEPLIGPEMPRKEGAVETPPEMSDSFPGDLPAAGMRFPVSAGESPYPRTDTPDWPPKADHSAGEALQSRPEPQQRIMREPVQPPVSERYKANQMASEEPANDPPESPYSALPAGVRPHMVNKMRFELLYDVESIGSAGISQVELWGTRDYGKTWSSYGVDDDGRSPMLVKVDGEGVYGFRVVVTTGAGVTGAVPSSGDLPDVWVGVDQTKPVGSLISAEQGSGDEADELIIVWEAEDEQLAERPISLRMSESPAGPWHTIASGLENTGRYVWRVDQRTPGKVYLRLEVRDEAGNVRIDDSTEPVDVQQVRPQGRIRDVRPFGEAKRPSRTTHNLLK